MDIICNNLYLKTKIIHVRDFIVKSTIDMIDTSIETKEIYQEKLLYLKKKNQTVRQLSYEEFKNLNIIYLVTAFLFISLQTSLPPLFCNPSIKNKKKCSFSGYPMNSMVSLYFLIVILS